MTIKRFAILQDNKVINITEAEISYGKSKGWIQSDLANIGDLYENGQFNPPALEPIEPNYILFYDSLLISNVYQDIRQDALTSLPLTLACTEFVAAITDAKYGTANVLAIQSCINNIFTLFEVDSIQREELENILISTGLNSLYFIP
jgi:hypothetical protein